MTKEKTPLKWKFKTGDTVISSPTVSDGVIYFGSEDNHLYAIDIKTGKEKWKFETGDSISSSPAISDGVVYFGNLDNHLYAIDIKTGEEKWKFETAYENTSSPAVSDGVVYLGSRDGYFYALDNNTGEEKWKFEDGGSISSSPAISDGVVYFGSEDKHCYALDAKTGKEKWKFETGRGVYSSPAVVGGVVYFGSIDNHLYAIDIKTGKEKWKFETGDPVPSSPAVSDGVVYFGSRDNHLYAVDIQIAENAILKNEPIKKIKSEKILGSNEMVRKLDQNVPVNFKKDLDELISKFPSESLTYTVNDQLTIDYWSSYYHMGDIPEIEVKMPESLSDKVSFPSIVEDLFGDPVNIDDLEYHHDRVYGISINEKIFGFIIKHASDDEIQAYLDDDEYVIKEQLILKSNHEYFIELISLALKVEFCKKYIDKN